MKKIITMLVIILSFLIVSINDVSAKTFPFKHVHDEYKEWTITFSNEIDKSSVTNETVYIQNYDTKELLEIEYKFSDDNEQIIVKPIQPYEKGFDMVLVIDKVVNIHGEELKDKTHLVFTYFPIP